MTEHDIETRLLALIVQCELQDQQFEKAIVHDAREEIVRLRALITEWADAELGNDFTHNDTVATRYVRAMDALREEANR